jgi:hypothetical protein
LFGDKHLVIPYFEDTINPELKEGLAAIYIIDKEKLKIIHLGGREADLSSHEISRKVKALQEAQIGSAAMIEEGDILVNLTGKLVDDSLLPLYFLFFLRFI